IRSGSWAMYFTCAGEPEVLGGRGTFTIVPEAPVGLAYTKSTLQGTGQSVPDVGPVPPGVPQGNFDISFDGFCDGMNLNSKLAAIGGTLTGCGSGIAGGNHAQELAGMIPNDSNTGPGANIGTSAASGCVSFYSLYWNDQKWAFYVTCGGEIP